MITAEGIKDVNKTIESITLKTNKGKDKKYVMVNERIKAFRELCPEGSITTDIVSHTDSGKGRVVVMKTTITNEAGQILATGYAYENETASYVNKTSYIENCETSAVGRALGMLGIGVDDNICSAEELVNAVTNQKKKDPEKKVDTPAPEEKTTQPDQPAVTNRIRFIAFCKKHGYDLDEIKERFGITESTNEIRFGALLNQLMDEVQEAKTNGQQRV